MVKWIKKVLRYTKIIIVFGQRHKSSSKALFQLEFFCYDDLYCCVKYSNVAYRVEIFNT